MFVTIVVAMLAMAQTQRDCQEMVHQPRHRNLFAEFANNKFNSWHLSPRIDMPVAGQRVEVTPTPRTTWYSPQGRVVAPKPREK